jgi:hypothetical protein
VRLDVLAFPIASQNCAQLSATIDIVVAQPRCGCPHLFIPFHFRSRIARSLFTKDAKLEKYHEVIKEKSTLTMSALIFIS